jgi:hypothetical protein
MAPHEADARQNCLTRATSSEAQPVLAWLVIITETETVPPCHSTRTQQEKMR